MTIQSQLIPLLLLSLATNNLYAADPYPTRSPSGTNSSIDTPADQGETTPKNSIYKTVDDKGKVIFSDHPIDKENSQAIDIIDPNLQSPPGYIPPHESKEPVAASTYEIRLSAPAEGTRFGPADRSVRVSAFVSPNLGQKHQLIYFLSGNRVVGPTRSLSADIPLGLKQRGSQTLSARIVDEQGNVIASSGSINIYVIRP